MKMSLIVGALLLLGADAASAKTMTSRERLRQEAQNLCYDDVQRLCPDVVSDEAAVQACMRSKRGQLSPACRRVFDQGR